MMLQKQVLRRTGWLLSCASLAVPAVMAQDNASLPIFDTHVHYSADAWKSYTPEEIIQKMQNANVPRALVSSSPDEGTRKLHVLDPERIVPFLRPYHGDIGPRNWFEDDAMLDYFQQRLQTLEYAGIGEFHLHYDGNADVPVVRQTARMAVERDFYLHVHSNSAAVRVIFGYEPDVKILWAHAGLSEPPEVAMQLMDEYRNLWVDISIREHAIAPGGELSENWQALFLKHPDRITIGSDTWIPSRWGQYEQVIEFDRGWLAQLPREVAEKIAYRNAVRLFGAGPHKHLQE
jgi:hypothetical protein